MLEVHAILQRQRCNENITKKTGTLSDAYEDEYITVPDTAAHTLVYHTAEGTDTLAHISPAGAEKIPHRIIQTEHGNRCIG